MRYDYSAWRNRKRLLFCASPWKRRFIRYLVRRFSRSSEFSRRCFRSYALFLNTDIKYFVEETIADSNVKVDSWCRNRNALLKCNEIVRILVTNELWGESTKCCITFSLSFSLCRVTINIRKRKSCFTYWNINNFLLIVN